MKKRWGTGWAVFFVIMGVLIIVNSLFMPDGQEYTILNTIVAIAGISCLFHGLSILDKEL